MVRRSNEISREICRAQDADDEPSTTAVRDAARTMTQAHRRSIARRMGANTAIPVTPDEAVRQKSELS